MVKLDYRTKRFWTDGLGSLFVAVLVAFTIRWAFVEAYVIPSGSMLPSLLVHDHIFVSKFTFGIRFPFTEKWIYKNREPKRGEVIVFKNPEDPKIFYIKRVVGLPGDKVYYESGNLYVNDVLVEKSMPEENKEDFDWLRPKDFRGEGSNALENYVHWEEKLGEYNYSVLLPKDEFLETESGPYTVPAGQYFMMGDNRKNSRDSRRWDPDKRFVPFEYLIGRAMFVWLSCEEVLPVIPICNPISVRGKRFFHSVH